jgi:hypothetical protein
MTMVDSDLELILLEDIATEKMCESKHHPLGQYGHRDSDLVYVRFLTCLCAEIGVTIRCRAWIETTKLSNYWMCATCGTSQVKTSEWYRELGPVEKA